MGADTHAMGLGELNRAPDGLQITSVRAAGHVD